MEQDGPAGHALGSAGHVPADGNRAQVINEGVQVRAQGGEVIACSAFDGGRVSNVGTTVEAQATGDVTALSAVGRGSEVLNRNCQTDVNAGGTATVAVKLDKTKEI